MNKIESTTGTTKVVFPSDKHRDGIIGWVFVIRETPHSDAGKFHAGIRYLKDDGSLGADRTGKYFATCEESADFLNQTFSQIDAKLPGCSFSFTSIAEG